MPKVQYTIRIEDKYFEKAKVIAEKEVRSLNNLLEFSLVKMIEDYEKEHGSIPFSDKS